MKLDEIFDISGKSIIVVGSSRGIGKYLSEKLTELGAHVYGISRTHKKSRIFKSYSCDINEKKEVEITLEKISKECMNVDCLVNVVGITKKFTEDHYLSIFKDTLNTNLTSLYQISKMVTDLMTRDSCILNFCSIGGIQGFPANPGYVASKGALIALTKSMAIDLEPKGIRVNAISPGYILTDMTQASYLDPNARNERLNRMIIKRWGDPSDLLGIVVYLCSCASSYVTGQNFIVDGGWTAKGL